MSGDELATVVRERCPSTSILFVSGFMDNASVREGVLDLGLPFLQKPFTPRHLAQRVRDVLDAERMA
jgi:DNA-binding response OmpR family regulator